jgi:peptidoglycan/LPS O-acetylase OafA/YrhL
MQSFDSTYVSAIGKLKNLMNPKVISNRRYELDWLRIFAILVLMFFHTGRIFDTQPWHIKNNEISENSHYWMTFIRTWRMPLLFFISGVGSMFAFRKSASLQYIFERFKRLIIPLIFAIVIVLPPQVYYEHKSEFNNYWEFYKSVWNFLPYHNGDLNLYHLWFLTYLFAYSLIGMPILIFLRSARSNFFKKKVLHFFYNPIAILIGPPISITITRLVLMPGHAWSAYFISYLSFFLFGIIFYSSSEYIARIGKNRKYLLFASLLMLIPFSWSYGFQNTNHLYDILSIQSLHEIMSIFVGWFWVITLVGYAQRYLNFSNNWLPALSEGIYPFYILHQTVIVIIGYYICQLQWSIAAKFWSINFLTLVFTVTIYVLCIRPFNILRIPFGLKLKRRAPSTIVKGIPVH